MADFTWLHLSDLHFKQTEEFETTIVREKLLKKLYNIGPVDYLFLTGDLAFKGDYRDVDTSLLTIISATKVSKDNIFWAVGNHDIQRIPFREQIIQGIRKSKNKSRDFETILENDLGYSLLSSQGYDDYFKISQSTAHSYELGDCPHFICEKKDINIVQLNTCLTSCNDEDPHKLLVCSRHLNMILNKLNKNKPTFILAHHSLQFLADDEQVKLNDILHQCDVDIYLCGHAHRPGYRPIDNAQYVIHEFTAGGIVDRDAYPLNSFYYGTYVDKTKEIVVEPYCYYDKFNLQWDINDKIDGYFAKNKSFILSRIAPSTLKNETFCIANDYGLTVNPEKNTFVDEMESLHIDGRLKTSISILGHEQTFARYSQLFSEICILPSPLASYRGNELILNLAKEIINDKINVPLLLNGNVGSGKSTFLTLLYFALFQTPGVHKCIYFNLHTYEKMINKNESQQQFITHSQVILALLRKSDDKFILLLDGLDDFFRKIQDASKAWLDEVLSITSQANKNKKIVAVGTWHDITPDEKILGILRGSKPHNVILLQNLVTSKRNIELFTETQTNDALEIKSETTKLKTIFDEWQLYSVDFRFLCMVRDSLLAGNHIDSFGDYLGKFCLENLQQQASLRKAAKDAFMAFHKRDKNIKNKKIQPLLFKHRYVSDYLSAYCMYDNLLNGLSIQGGNILKSNIVFPENANKILKELILAETEVNVKKIFNNVIKWLHDNDITIEMRMQLIYLLPRVFGNRVSQKQITQELMTQHSLLKNREDEALSDILLRRTIICSLAMVGNNGPLFNFIKEILSATLYQETNIKFYCDYYAFTNENSNINRVLELEIEAAKVGETISRLYIKIKRALKSCQYTHYNLFLLDVTTYFTLLQLRYTSDNPYEPYESLLADGQELLKELLDNAISYENISKIDVLLHYLNMLNLYWRIKTPIGILEEVYNLKKFKRAGWEKRGLKNGESIADHICGMYYLGLFLLPNNPPITDDYNYDGYNKDEILKIVMLHDIGEAKEGDIPTDNKTDEDRRKEEKLAMSLLTCGSYLCLSNQENSKKLLQEFYQESTLNGKIASELDKVENYLQLCLYEKQGVVFKDAKSWKRSIREQINIPLVIDIFLKIEKHFDLLRKQI